MCLCARAAVAQLVQRLATGWTVRGSNPGGGRDFPHPPVPDLGPTQPPIQWVPGLSRGVKRPGRGVDHPPSSNSEVKERVELYLYSPLWAFITCYGVNLTRCLSDTVLKRREKLLRKERKGNIQEWCGNVHRMWNISQASKLVEKKRYNYKIVIYWNNSCNSIWR